MAPEVFREHPRDSSNCGLRKGRQGPWRWGQNQMTRAQRWPAIGRVAATLTLRLSPRESVEVGQEPSERRQGEGQMTSPLWVSGSLPVPKGAAEGFGVKS